MTLRRVAMLAGLLACGIAGHAVAQVPMGNLPTFDTAPPAPPPGTMPPGAMAPAPGTAPAPSMAPSPGMAPAPGMGPGSGMAPGAAMGGFSRPAAQEPPCMREFAPLREAAEK